MLGFIITTVAGAVSLIIVDALFKGVAIASFPTAIVAGLVLGLLNGGIRPILQLLSLPLTILTLGGFSLIVNGFCFWLASVLVPGFHVSGIISFIFAPIILSLVSTLIDRLLVDKLLANN
jgi:putative membrane protein